MVDADHQIFHYICALSFLLFPVGSLDLYNVLLRLPQRQAGDDLFTIQSYFTALIAFVHLFSWLTDAGQQPHPLLDQVTQRSLTLVTDHPIGSSVHSARGLIFSHNCQNPHNSCLFATAEAHQ